MKRVCVIGAGVSGLVAVKELLDEGHSVRCFEASQSLGGAFAQYGTSSSRAYESLYLTISNYYMAFSDFPPEDGWKIWTGSQYRDYLLAYAEHFELPACMEFDTKVVKIEEEEEQDGRKKWLVTTEDGSGKRKTDAFDAVAVCCGTHQTPKMPAIEGIDSFSGDICHSYDFWNAKDYAGKRVVVVGLGESSADIVRDVSNVSESCHLVLRQYPFVLPRVLPNGFPADSMTSRLLYPSRDDSFFVWFLFFIFIGLFWLPMTLLGFSQPKWPSPRDAFGQEIGACIDINTPRTDENVGLLAKWHDASNVTWVNKFATKNASWVPNVLSGKIDVRLGTIARIAGDKVTLKDGMEIEADILLLCTGYRDEFSFLPPHVAPKDNDVRRLFLHSFNPSAGPSIAFIGFARPTTGAIPICSELVARYFALLVSGKRQLPNDAQAQAEEDLCLEDSMMYNSQQVRSCVNPCEYMDAVARLIGCYRSSWYYAWRPLAYMRWMSALNCAARFRLTGPHAKPVSAQQWLDKIPITVPYPAMVILCVHKMAQTLNLVSNDLMMELRKRKVELTWVLAKD